MSHQQAVSYIIATACFISNFLRTFSVSCASSLVRPNRRGEKCCVKEETQYHATQIKMPVAFEGETGEIHQ